MNQTDNLTFSQALVLLKDGYKLARNGWNGKGMWIILQTTIPNIYPYPGSCYDIALSGIQETVTIDAHIDMYTAQGTMQPGWLASQADMLADDWELVE